MFILVVTNLIEPGANKMPTPVTAPITIAELGKKLDDAIASLSRKERELADAQKLVATKADECNAIRTTVESVRGQINSELDKVLPVNNAGRVRVA